MCPHFSTTRGFKQRKGVGPGVYYYEKHTLRYIFLEPEEIKTVMPDEYRLDEMNYDTFMDLVENGTLKVEELDIQL